MVGVALCAVEVGNDSALAVSLILKRLLECKSYEVNEVCRDLRAAKACGMYLEVYNGDVGFVKSVDPEERSMTVTFDGRPVAYDGGDLDELVLAYAMTIHKSQGSEYPAVIVIVHTQHYVMLQRNLLYTAITRGKKLVLLIGSPYAVSRAIETNTVRERRTSLAGRLQTSGDGE